jgi:hypothetical protein
MVGSTAINDTAYGRPNHLFISKAPPRFRHWANSATYSRIYSIQDALNFWGNHPPDGPMEPHRAPRQPSYVPPRVHLLDGRSGDINLWTRTQILAAPPKLYPGFLPFLIVPGSLVSCQPFQLSRCSTSAVPGRTCADFTALEIAQFRIVCAASTWAAGAKGTTESFPLHTLVFTQFKMQRTDGRMLWKSGCPVDIPFASVNDPAVTTYCATASQQ